MSDQNGFQLVRRQAGGLIRSANLGDIFPAEKERPELWLFLVPHDDDAVIGCGLLLQKAAAEKKQIRVLISSDGAMGYCDLKTKKDIAAIRVRETRVSL
ncbi:MAG: hypothetical protein EHM45_21705, partial [Desulfobacteraceae bacterium]